jgi:hypothetical protein
MEVQGKAPPFSDWPLFVNSFHPKQPKYGPASGARPTNFLQPSDRAGTWPAPGPVKRSSFGGSRRAMARNFQKNLPSAAISPSLEACRTRCIVHFWDSCSFWHGAPFLSALRCAPMQARFPPVPWPPPFPQGTCPRRCICHTPCEGPWYRSLHPNPNPARKLWECGKYPCTHKTPYVEAILPLPTDL